VSLVNEMLRDLDTRRRDNEAAPADGLGVSMQAAGGESRGIGLRSIMVVVIAGLVGATMSLLLASWLRGGDNGEAERAGAVSSPLPDRGSETSAASNELRLLSDRLLALEEQNQSLQRRADEAQQALRMAEQQALEQQSRMEQIRQEAERQSQLAQQRIAEVDIAAPAPPVSAPASGILNPTPQQAPSALAPPPAASSVLQRTVREMSLRERDRQQVQDALRLWAANEQNAALQALDAFAVEYPEAHQSRETLAKLLIERGDLAAAQQAADIGLMIAPQHDGYRKIRARLLLAEGAAAEAFSLLGTRPPALSADPEYHDLLASAALAAADYERAVLVYEQLLDRDETVGRWWYGLAAALDAQGRSNAAIQAYEQALRTTDLNAALRQLSSQRISQLHQQE